MASNSLKIAFLVESQLAFEVVPAVIVVEEEGVHAGDTRQRVTVVIGRRPYLGHDVVSEGTFEELREFVVIY